MALSSAVRELSSSADGEALNIKAAIRSGRTSASRAKATCMERWEAR